MRGGVECGVTCVGAGRFRHGTGQAAELLAQLFHATLAGLPPIGRARKSTDVKKPPSGGGLPKTLRVSKPGCRWSLMRGRIRYRNMVAPQ